jgi:hypothetical protein
MDNWTRTSRAVSVRAIGDGAAGRVARGDSRRQRFAAVVIGAMGRLKAAFVRAA